MKNHFLIFVILLNIVVGTTIENYAHEQRTHQYIVREAYTLLTQFLGRPIPIMQASLGYNQDGGFVSHWPGNNGYPWIEGKIVAGAFREDEEDVMYGCGKSFKWNLFLYNNSKRFSANQENDFD